MYIANAIVATEVVLNVAMRHAHLLPGVDPIRADEIYLYGNDLCWIMLSSLPLLFARGAERLIALALAALVLMNPIDGTLFGYNTIGINEWLWWSVAAAGIIEYTIQTRPKFTIRGEYLLVLGAMLVHTVFRNQPDDLLAFRADALGHFAMAAFCFRMLKHRNNIVATVFVVVATANMLQVVYGDPYKPYMYEYLLAAYFTLRGVWLWAVRRSANVQRVHVLYYAALATHLLLLVAIAVLLRIYFNAQLLTLVLMLVAGGVLAGLFLTPQPRHSD